MTQTYDLKDRQNPEHIREYGLVGRQPGSAVEPVPTDLHGPISLGDGVYFGHGTGANGIMQIADRTRLLTKGAPPTPENLLAPQISRLDMSFALGRAPRRFRCSASPSPRTPTSGSERRVMWVVIVNESTDSECREEAHQRMSSQTSPT
jgi:hypothetical protein